MCALPAFSVAAPVATVAVSCRGLRKRYGDVVAVDGIDLDVRQGECFGLLGPNGAGKTTTIEIFEGLKQGDEGEVTVLGARWGEGARQDHALRERLGIQLQETKLAEKLTVEETVRLFRSFYRNGPSTDEVIRRVSLEEKRRAWVNQLSGGQRQRLSIACSLVNDPDILFLDEPTTGLDPQSRRQLWDLIDAYRRDGRTVVMTTHYMDEAERLCDRVAIVDHGRVIAEDTPAGLIRSLGADHVVRFTADGPLDEPALGRLPGVTQLRREGSGLALHVRAAHTAIPALLGELERQGRGLSHLTTSHATLEDVFVHLTGRTLRDE